MRQTFWISACVSSVLISASPSAWSNGGKSLSLTQPIFGTHDYIAYRGYVMADRPTFIKNNLNSFYRLDESFTEMAPDAPHSFPGLWIEVKEVSFVPESVQFAGIQYGSRD